ncbi:solute carrier family 28 member 3-like [Amblyomma americanum]
MGRAGSGEQFPCSISETMTCASISSVHISTSQIRWARVVRAVLLQLASGALLLRWGPGRASLGCAVRKATAFLDVPREASQFMFGHLTSGVNLADFLGEAGQNATTVKPPFVFGGMTVMFYVSFFVSVLYYCGLAQAATRRVVAVLRLVTGATSAECVSCVGSIFLGPVEAPLAVAPELADLTPAQLHCVMAGSFANVSVASLAAFVLFGLDAGHLALASLMSVPAALAAAELLHPETAERPVAREDEASSTDGGSGQSILEAVSRGIMVTLLTVGGIAINIAAFLAFVALANHLFVTVLNDVGAPPFSFEDALGVVFAPLALMMGVPWEDSASVGQLIGTGLLANQFVAYLYLVKMARSLHPRSVLIATYALCGSTSLGSLGIAMATLAVLCPARMDDVSQLVLRAMCAGSLASFMTACVAGSLVG